MPAQNQDTKPLGADAPEVTAALDRNTLIAGFNEGIERLAQGATPDLARHLRSVLARGRIVMEVNAVRAEQDTKHGGPAEDDSKDSGEWMLLLEHRIRRAHAPLQRFPADLDLHRRELLHVVATAFAALESFDRCAMAMASEPRVVKHPDLRTEPVEIPPAVDLTTQRIADHLRGAGFAVTTAEQLARDVADNQPVHDLSDLMRTTDPQCDGEGPPRLVFVSGGPLTPGAQERVREYIASTRKQRPGDFSSVMLPADPALVAELDAFSHKIGPSPALTAADVEVTPWIPDGGSINRLTGELVIPVTIEGETTLIEVVPLSATEAHAELNIATETWSAGQTGDHRPPPATCPRCGRPSTCITWDDAGDDSHTTGNHTYGCATCAAEFYFDDHVSGGGAAIYRDMPLEAAEAARAAARVREAAIRVARGLPPEVVTEEDDDGPL